MFVRSRVIIESQELLNQGLNAEIASLREILRLKNEVLANNINRIWELERENRLMQFKLDVFVNKTTGACENKNIHGGGVNYG